ncbi:uncharacterized protein LOC130555017 isoform X2 [Triplophysa rosa]|uniref:Protein AKNAD1 n=1 Tax=Triplophysa rosa TaxID=992332 RepID=A0A9W8C788_TRIRA|nr:uncharacterized protein LOC130555017 isoform X2 [Triplophysa rosa]KAI7809515.1 putative protein AKNAD1 [Triplophysa rosa]
MSRDASQTRTSSRSGFDGTPTGDADGEDDARSRPSSVLWEKRIEQSIFVDISDDDSLHFSDLQDAFTVHLSQGSGAPGSPQFTDVSCETEKGSTESTESISSECVEHINKSRKTPMHRSAVKAVVERHEDDAINTSDEEHEELPYDGAHTSDKTGHDVHATYSNGSEIFAVMSVKETSNHKATKPAAPPVAVSHISDVLLRHFTQEELLNSSRMIEAETLPEISLMDSADETVLSRVVSRAPRINSEERETIQNKIQEPNSTTAKSDGLLDVTVSEEDMEEAANNCSDTNVSNVSNSSNKPENMFIEDTASSRGSDVVSAGDDVSPKQSFSASSLDLSKADVPKVSFSRTRSFSEMKYGQGQVHYPLPDFSKVAPKVKIPKGNGTVKPISHSQSPALARVQSSPVILGKNTSSATADVISRVLEDSHVVFSDKEEQSGLAHQLQAEYDRLLAKYTDTENLIGQQIHASSEPSVSISWSETTTNNDNITKLTAKTPQAPTAGSGEEQCCLVQNSLPVQTEPQTLTDGERLTSDLREIISSFVQKVDEFKTCVNTMSMNVQEQQMMLKSMMEAQDQLERNYLTKREEHRALEMQNYMGLARNTGEFDPDREVEGQIFRIGMHLEDIKEQIDRNVCHLFNPPPSSPTPSPPPCKDTSLASPHSSLHEESLFCISTMRENMENEEEEDFEVGDEDIRAESSFILQCSTFTTPTPGTANEEDNLTATGEEDFYEDVLTQGSTPAALKQKLTYDRCEEKTRPGEGSLSSVGIHYTGPSAENSPEPTRDKTQRFVRPEIDSGFGSSDISRPTTGLSHTSPNALSSSALSDDVISVASISGSDSDASYSNERTTISIATRPVQPTVNNMDYEELDTTELAQNAPLKVNKVEKASIGGAVSIHENMIEGGGPVHLGKNNAAYETPNRDRHSSSHCSCHNSEVILALQYEVSHLKRALEESLSHLPHMSRRADYVTGRSHSERRHRAQTRGSNRLVKTDTSLQRTEDWISSDMEPSISKVTEGDDSDHTLSFQRAFSPSHEQTHGRLSSLSDRRSCDTRSPSKASVQSTSQFDPSRSHQRESTGLSIHNKSAETRSTYKSVTHRQAMGNLGNIFINSKKSASCFTAHTSHKPLLQVNYGSSCSLPAGFKVRDQESEPPVSSRRRSAQSDSALLPSNVFFQRTSRTPGRRHYTREESIHKTLDKALQAAFLMKQTTDRMADALSGDLAKAQLQKKFYGIHPLRSRTRNCDFLSTCSSQAN